MRIVAIYCVLQSFSENFFCVFINIYLETTTSKSSKKGKQVKMVKKRRQGDPGVDDSDSTSDENYRASEKNGESTPKCLHAKKSVDCTKLRRKYKQLAIEMEKCADCNKTTMNGADAEKNEDDYEMDLTLWMCLKCGTHLCGRTVNKHALKHFQTPRSDSHALALNTTTGEVWCYECTAFVRTIEPNLQQCIDWINAEIAKPKASLAKSIQPQQNGDDTATVQTNGDGNKDGETPEINQEAMRSLLGHSISLVHSLGGSANIPGQAKRILTNDVNKLPRVRGLSNLGNTCFFNAVMQCLAQTPYLLPALKELSKPDEEFSLPGGKFTYKDEEVELEPISGKLKPWGPLTSALAEALEELQSGGGVYNPRKLFSALTKLLPQFSGGDQHDSHELLRHLLESVKTEDLKRYQKVILDFLNCKDYHRGKNLEDVPDEIKQRCKFYGQQASDRILCPEKVFRGFLVSTLTCQDCENTSSRHENFLDLSLPVCVAPPTRRKSTPDELHANKENLKSKYVRQHEQRNNKNNKNRSSSSQEESDADVEDNLSEDFNGKKKSIAQNLAEKVAAKNKLIDSNGNIESEKQDDDPENLNKDLNESKAANNEYLEVGISAKGGKELVQQISHEDKLESTATDETSLLDSFQQMKLADRKDKQTKLKRKRLHSYIDWSSTFAPRYHCEDGECSVHSCLNNFTQAELMTGNNKVGCSACSERINGKDGKTINTNATKQFLISSPPAVLILHLKRFQVGPRCMFRKMTKHVSFPLVLDLAPFCASKVKTLPNVHRYQRKLIYSLYGIVEHSGGMYGGHYVAYVKVRPNLSPDDPRWKFLPKGSKVELDQTDEQKALLEDLTNLKENRLQSGDSDDSTSDSSSSDSGIGSNANKPHEVPPAVAEAPPGKWYYVSDSHVMETTEEKVLSAQAYLLFYERIY